MDKRKSAIFWQRGNTVTAAIMLCVLLHTYKKNALIGAENASREAPNTSLLHEHHRHSSIHHNEAIRTRGYKDSHNKTRECSQCMD